MAQQQDANPRLVGRARELGVLAEFLADARKDGAALLLTGEPGVGKTALLDATTEIATDDGVRVVRGAGVEYETDVSFAGLHQLVDQLDGELQRLPAAARGVLEAALGISPAPTPERLAVLNAALALFRSAADDAALLLVLDDMHWLDRASASVIGFVGRRLAGSPVGLLAATRTGAGGFFDRTGWAELAVPPLAGSDALELLSHQFAHLPKRVLAQVADEAQGNPLALLEFASAVRRPHGPGPETGTGREVKALFNARIAALPDATRTLLLVAALEGSGDLAVVAAANPSGTLDDLAPAELDHLVLVDDASSRITFRHPLIKTVMVDRSTFEERRRVHLALAGLYPDSPERRGHHLGEAALSPDEATAAAVEDGARSTLRRGDVVGAVARLLRAAELTPAGPERNRRLADAAFIGAFSTGRLDDASRMLRDATRGDATAAETLQAAVATSYVLLISEADAEMAHQLLTDALRSALDDPDLHGQDFSQALYTLAAVCQFAGRPEYWQTWNDVVARLPAPVAADATVVAEVQGDPLTASPASLAELDDAIDRLDRIDDVSLIVRTAVAGFNVDRLDRCRHALERVVRDGREGGAAASGVMALTMIAFDDFHHGRWDDAEQAGREARELCADLGYRLYEWSALYALVLVAANRGEECEDACGAMLEWAAPRGLGRLSHWAHHALTQSAMGRGDFEAAYAHAEQITEPGTLATHNPQALWTAPDLVEAALRTGRTDEAQAHAEAFSRADLGRLSPRFVLGTAVVRALVAPDDEGAGLLADALDSPGVQAWPFELARARLTHGERLRRARRPREARTQLEAARASFESIGARSWAARAAAELRATGARRGTAAGTGADALTPQELEVAQLAASGLTNREIAARLYVSPRTVSAHLYRVFPKLGITSRAALRDALDGGRAGRMQSSD